MLIACKETSFISLAIWPAINTFPLEMVFHKIASVILEIIFEPEFSVLIFFPARDIKKVRPGTMTHVISPLANVQFTFTIPMRAPPFSYPASPIPRVYRALSKGYWYLKAPITVKLSVAKISNVFAATPRRF